MVRWYGLEEDPINTLTCSFQWRWLTNGTTRCTSVLTGGADVLVRADPDAALMGLITKRKTLKMAPSAEESAERRDPQGQMFATVLALSSLPSFPALMAKAGRCE